MHARIVTPIAAALALGALFASGPALAARKPALPASATPQGLVGGRPHEAPCPHCPDTLAAGATPAIQLTGRLAREGESLVLESCSGRVALEGMTGESVEPLVGHEAWINGLCTGRGRIAALGGHSLADSAVDLFVMAFCPFGRALEKQMAADILRDTLALPPVRVHYILYTLDDSRGSITYAKHGDQELRETIVQQAVRELEPRKFWPWLQERASSDSSWTWIADRVGIAAATRAEAQRRLDHELQDRAHAEWQAMTVDWPHIDGSPTVFWRGRLVNDIADVPGFNRAKMPGEKCKQ
jgi:hypothetical protein